MGSVTCAAIGVVVCIAVLAFLIHHRDAKLVRATSFPISLFLLICVSLLFLETLLHVAPPSASLCLLRQIAFPLVYTVLYAALFARTLRIFLIFRASDQLRRATRCVSNRAQAILVLSIVGVQGLLLSSLALTHGMGHVDREMPNPLLPRIQVVCRSADLCLHIPTLYNTGLILICACLGFVTRHLPDNFRETMCLFLCSCSTLILWACFFPIYSCITGFASRSLLQLLVLHLSAIVYLASLFIPKVYALLLQTRKDNSTTTDVLMRSKKNVPGRDWRSVGRFSLNVNYERRMRQRKSENDSPLGCDGEKDAEWTSCLVEAETRELSE